MGSGRLEVRREVGRRKSEKSNKAIKQAWHREGGK
jgi:hypothetical protein